MTAPLPLLQVWDLKKHYPLRGGWFGGTKAVVHAVDGISFEGCRPARVGLFDCRAADGDSDANNKNGHDE